MSKITKHKIAIDVYYYSNIKDLTKEFKKRLKERDIKLKPGCSIIGFADHFFDNHTQEIKVGEIHVPIPKQHIKNILNYREEIMGHELRHIIEQDFHPSTIYEKKKKK